MNKDQLRDKAINIGKKVGNKWPYLTAAAGTGAMLLTLNSAINPDTSNPKDLVSEISQSNKNIRIQNEDSNIPTPFATPFALESAPTINNIGPSFPLDTSPNIFLGFADINGKRVEVCIPNNPPLSRLVSCLASIPDFAAVIPNDTQGRVCRPLSQPFLPASEIDSSLLIQAGSNPKIFTVNCEMPTANKVERYAVLNSKGEVRVLE